MGTDKPLVTILMATYNPPVQWFEKQLQSLNNQSYENIELIVIDDCSPKFSLEEIDVLIKNNITDFSYKLYRNDKNLGSTKTFEKLTSMATGKYVSYCDQDDIWESFKISKSVETIQKTGAKLVCSDVKVIDADNNITSESIVDIRKRQFFESGEGLSSTLLFRNFVIGCTILMEASLAKEALPFVDGMIHDHWLALYASTVGAIEVCDQKVMRYRIHGNNQTSTLSGINTKQDYYEKKIEPYFKQVNDIYGRVKIDILPETQQWAKARVDYFNGKFSAIRIIFRDRNLSKSVSYFEIFLKFMPNFFYKKILKKIQNGSI